MTSITYYLNKIKAIGAHIASMILRPPPEIGSSPNIKNEALFGALAILSFMLLFGLWAGFATIESAAVAPGKVIFAGSHKTIQHLEGGIVKRIMVQEGATVKKGDLLIELDDTQAKARYVALNNGVNNLYANEARLTALLADAKTVHFPEELLKQKENPTVRLILQTQLSLFNSEKKSLAGQEKISEQRVAQSQKQIQSYQAQAMSVAEQLKFVRLELDTFETLDKKRIIEKPRLWASQREYARLQGKREGLLGSIAEVEKKIGETRQQALTLIDNRKQENYEKLTETQEKLAKSIQEERNAQDILSRLKILAPLAGTVVGLQEHTIGGVISPGKPILDIVPSESELIVEARISPADIDAVHPGLATKVQLSAYKQRIPWVTGKVITVSANTFFEQQTNMTYYTSRIKISPKDIKQLKNVILYPGMPVEVMIITNNRSPLQYLLSPVRDSFNRAFREE